MACRYNTQCGKLCPHFAIVTEVAFATGTLTLTLPDDVTYSDRQKYCIVIGAALPDTTTINAPVVAVVGDGTTEFPLLTRCGAPVVAQQIATRRKYPVLISTTATGGSIRILSCLPDVDVTTLNALNDAVEGGAGA